MWVNDIAQNRKVYYLSVDTLDMDEVPLDI